jgi:hypothetical protein
MVARNALAMEAGLLRRQKDLHLDKVTYLLKIFYNKTVDNILRSFNILSYGFSRQNSTRTDQIKSFFLLFKEHCG